MSLFSRKTIVVPEPEPEPILTPGYCECGHERCCHIAGTHNCKVTVRPISAEWPIGGECACQIYIFDPDEDNDEDNDDDDIEDEPTPDPSELERMFT